MNKLVTGNLRAIVQQLEKNFPDNADEVFKMFGLAVKVLRHYLGEDWTNENIFSLHRDVSKRNRAGRRYFKTEEGVPENQFRYQHRVILLAELLFNLQEIKGVEQRVESIQTGNLESTFAELECASHIKQAGLNFSFVMTSGVKGQDFDIDIILSSGKRVHCELKAKAEQHELNKTSIYRTLDASRKQLPVDERGVVFLKIPDEWIKQPKLASIFQENLQKFFRQTNRVVAVVLLWEQWSFSQSVGGVVTTKFRVEINHNSQLLDKETQDMLEKLNNPSWQSWVRFPDILR